MANLQQSTLEITAVSARSNGWLVTNFETAGGPKAIIQRLIQYLEGISTGTESAYSAGNPPSIVLKIKGNAVAATGSVVFSDHASNNDQFLVNGVTFTAKTSGATGNQWNIGANLTATAVNLAAAINASATALVSSQVVASIPVAGTVLITSLFWGVAGNQTTIAKGTDGGSVMTVSGARLTGGAVDATAQTLNF